MIKKNSKEYNALNALYANMVVYHRYTDNLNANELATVAYINETSARDLDALNISWRVQNAVAGAGRLRKNWDRYNYTVINETVAACGGLYND